jgi:hypothetical protein
MKKITLLTALVAAFTMNAQIFFDDFNNETADATEFALWDNFDQDGDGNLWEVFDTSVIGEGLSIMTGFGADSDSWEGSAFQPDNYLITKDPLDLTGATGSTLTFKVGTYQTSGAFIADKYSVYLSETNNPLLILISDPVTTRLVSDDVTADNPDGSASAAEVTVDISAFDGQVVYLTFRHYDTNDENSVLIDDVLVDAALAVTDQTFNNFQYYVNANDELNLSANSEIESLVLYNVLGQQVISQKLANTNEVVNIAALNTGLYIATVSIDGNTKSFKIAKK